MCRSVAVFRGGAVTGQAEETGLRAGAIGLIEAALAGAPVDRKEIACIAVGLGPGSNTGIRAAIAVAQGWQLATSCRALGISSVETLAWQLAAEGSEGDVWIAVDAQRGEFSLAGFKLENAVARETSPLRLASQDEMAEMIGAGKRVVGPSFAERLPGAEDRFPTAAQLARLVASQTSFLEACELVPIHLRATNFVKAPLPRITPG